MGLLSVGVSVRWAAVRPVDAASLAVVRVAVGAVGVLSAARIVQHGWIDALYAGPSHRFTYLGLGWVPQPGRGTMVALVAAMAAAGAALAAGWHSRLASAALGVTFTWVELIDATTYLNHYWFLTLVLALGTVVPWGAALGLDARRCGRREVARGWVWLMRFQVGVVYASAGVAKLQSDWLVRAEPLRLWLPARGGDLPLVGPVLDEVAAAHVLSVAGAAFDCLVVPALLWRRTRVAAWLVLVAFHVSTWLLFPIGVFPWLMIGAATVFFPPGWPGALARRARAPGAPSRPRSPETGAAAVAGPPAWSPRRVALAVAAAAWIVVQVLLPLRHHAYPGDHRWTAQGYRFGWNVLLVERSGAVTFLVHDPATGTTRSADGSELYTPTQLRAMATEPDLIHQAALALAADAGDRRVEVRVDAWMSINGGPPARLVDPTVDLAAEPRDVWDDDWVTDRPPRVRSGSAPR